MKSLLSNYCSRLITIEDTTLDDEEDHEATSTSTSCSSSSLFSSEEKHSNLIVKDCCSIIKNMDTNNEKSVTSELFSELDELSELHSSFKYIDDIDTDGSNTISSEYMEGEENENNSSTCYQEKIIENKLEKNLNSYKNNNEIETKTLNESKHLKLNQHANSMSQLVINLNKTNQNGEFFNLI